MSGNIQFGIKVGYDGAAIAGGARANAEQIKAIGATAEAAGTQASRSLDRTALSAKQTAAALRGVPAQFTDIFTSIAAGQNPMQVFLQQGGQLKDMFGGTGPAARALGGYIAGLVNPYTVAAAAAAGLTYAYVQGSKEATAYTRALILSGNAAGTTAAQMEDAARRVARATGGTQGAVADALTQGIAGGVPGASLAAVAEAAVRMEQVTGRAIDDTVAEFAKLARDPVAASAKLNEQYNYLTAATYRQIKAFEEQGRHVDAVALAMSAYADAVAARTGEITTHLGLIEDKWLGLKAVTKGALDALFDLGRPGDALEAAVGKVQDIQARMRDVKKNAAYDPGTARAELVLLEEQLVVARAHMVTVRDTTNVAIAAAAAKGEANKRDKAGIDLSKEADKYITRQAQMKREMVRVEELYAKAISGTASEQEKAAAAENRRAAIAGIRDRFGEKKTTTRDGLDDAAREQAKGYAQQYEAAAKLARGIEAEAAAGEKLLPVERALADARATLTDAQARELEQVLAGALLIEARTKADREAAEAAKIHTGYIQSQIAPLEEHALKLEQEVSTYGMTISQIEAVSVARLQEARDIAAANGAFPEHLAYLDREIKARQRLVAAAGSKEALDANKKATEEMQRDWKRMHEQLSQSLTDQLMEGGHSAGELLENYFRTLILRPVIQGVVNIGMNAVGSALGFSGAGGAFGSVGGGGGGVGDLLSMGNSASSLFGGGTSAYTAFAMSEAGTSLGLSTAYIDALGIGEAVGGTALSALGTALPYIGAALAVASALGVFDGGGEDPHNNTQLTGFELGLNKGGAFAVQNADATGAPSAMSAGPTSGEGWWADSANLSAEQLAAINAQVTASFAQGRKLAELFGVDPSVIDAASVDSRYNGTAGNGHIQGYFSTMDQAFAALSDQIVKAVWPDVTKYQQAGKSVTQTLTDNIAALDAFNAGLGNLHKQFADFNNQLDLGAGSTLDPLSKYRTARGLYDTAIAGTDSTAAISAAKDFLQISRDVFSSTASYATDYGMVKTALAALESTLTTQASASLPESLKALQAAMPSHAAGLSVVPYDGYMATLHRDESVVDAGAMAAFRRYGIPAGGNSKAEAHAAASVRVQQAGFQLLADKLDALDARMAGIERTSRLAALAA